MDLELMLDPPRHLDYHSRTQINTLCQTKIWNEEPAGNEMVSGDITDPNYLWSHNPGFIESGLLQLMMMH